MNADTDTDRRVTNLVFLSRILKTAVNAETIINHGKSRSLQLISQGSLVEYNTDAHTQTHRRSALQTLTVYQTCLAASNAKLKKTSLSFES